MEIEYIYPFMDLEIRVDQGRPRLRGKFPYSGLATKRDRGSERKESIMPLAFRYAIQDESREISLLSGHDFDKPLGSRQRGSLTIRDDNDGVYFEASLPVASEQPSWVRDTMLAVQQGLISGISPGFKIPPAGVVPNAETLIEEANNPGVFIRQIHQAVLVEMSLVSRPAYPDTTIETRSLDLDTFALMRLI